MPLINEFAVYDYRHDWTLDANTLYDAGAWPPSRSAKPIAAASQCSLEALARSPTMSPSTPSHQPPGCVLSNDFTSWAGKHPLHWSRDDVLDWLFYVGVQGEHNVDFTHYPTEALNTSTGTDLARMTEGEFVQKMGPDYGSMLYALFWKAMRESGWTQQLQQRRPQLHRLQQVAGIHCDGGGGLVQAPLPTLPPTMVNAPTTVAMPASAATIPWSVGSARYENEAFALAFTPGCRTRSSCVYDDDEVGDPFARRFAPSLSLPPPLSSATRSSYVVAPPSPQPEDRMGDRQFSTESDDTAVLSRSDSGAEQASCDSPDEYDDDDEESDATSGGGGGAVAGPRRAGDDGGTSTGARGDAEAKCGSPKSKLLWEFVRDLLKDPLYNPRCIKWEDKTEGVFRFVQSDTVAKMWGRIKNNDNMTYEKLSRAMRYYYKRGILERVDGKRLVYKFSTGARGWS